MFNVTNSRNVACTCPLCGAALAVRSIQPGADDAQDAYDRAQGTVLEHLFAMHKPAIEHATVVALGALAQAGASSLKVSATHVEAAWR
jgi:hypothetical protein